MPELPEVETVKTGLQKLLPGKAILGIEFDNEKSFPNNKDDVKKYVIGATVKDVTRRAKVLFINLSTNYTLLVHLKMTGQLVFCADGGERFGAGHPTDSLISKLPNSSTRVILRLQDATLFFNDQRKFGWMKLVSTSDIEEINFIKNLGPEPIAEDFDVAKFKERLSRYPNRNVKAALLDQKVISGVGNIYADESLWGAKLHPAIKVRSISTLEMDRLFKELCLVLRLGIEKGGSTDKNYVNAEGEKGSYTDFARVFRREGQLCSRCNNIIVKLRVAGRGTHVCEDCQIFREGS